MSSIALCIKFAENMTLVLGGEQPGDLIKIVISFILQGDAFLNSCSLVLPAAGGSAGT